MKISRCMVYLTIEERELSATKIGGSAEVRKHEGGDLTKEKPGLLRKGRGGRVGKEKTHPSRSVRKNSEREAIERRLIGFESFLS